MQERDPELERNFIIFMIIVMMCIFGWLYFSGRKMPPRQTPEEKPIVQEPVSETPKPGAEPTQPLPGSPASGILPAEPGTVSALQPLSSELGEEKTVEVRSSLYRIIFTNYGAVPKSWELLKYQDRVYFPIEISLRWPPVKRIEKFEPKPVQLIPPEFADRLPLRSKIIINGIEISPKTSWQTEAKEILVEKGPEQLVFSLPLAGGAVLKKIYTFYPDQYQAELKIEYSGVEPDPKQSGVEFEMNFLFEPLSRIATLNFHGPVLYTGKKLVKFALAEINKITLNALKQKANSSNKKDPLSESLVDWAGFTDSYFLTALLAPPDAPMSARAYYAGTEEALSDKNANKEYGLLMKFEPSARLLTNHYLAELRLYYGPKEKTALEKARNTLPLVIDYRMFGISWAPIAIPLMYALVYTNKLVKNFGWSIVILTIILRMAMFPLIRRGQKSMKEFQRLQPEIEKIRKKYPNDRLKQQEEIYALQRKYKINPFGGCLPMLIQFPIFLAFYKVLLVSIELRHAPWMLWIQDLSSRDPLLILPLLMGVSQFLMQKFMPTSPTIDPTQAKMMMILPLIFTLFLIYFPSGLLLYWTVSNIIGIVQQIYVNKTLK